MRQCLLTAVQRLPSRLWTRLFHVASCVPRSSVKVKVMIIIYLQKNKINLKGENIPSLSYKHILTSLYLNLYLVDQSIILKKGKSPPDNRMYVKVLAVVHVTFILTFTSH